MWFGTWELKDKLGEKVLRNDLWIQAKIYLSQAKIHMLDTFQNCTWQYKSTVLNIM